MRYREFNFRCVNRVKLFAGLLLFAAISGVSAADPAIWDFESGKSGWKPEVMTITVSRSKDVTATGDSKTSLHIRGSCKGSVNYAACSEPYPMTTREFYSLSAWVRFDRLGVNTPLPYLKCEFEAEMPGSYLGQALIDSYDVSRIGTWQRLTGEFRVPYGAERGRLTFGSKSRLSEEKDILSEIDVYLDDITLEPIEHLSIEGKYYLKPFPASLEKVRGIHPRLYLTEKRISELREAIKTTHASLWEEIREQADGIAKREPPAYMDEDGWSNIEQLYMRGVGNNMPLLAMAYLMTGEKKYLDSARKWALAACGYPTWGLYEFANVDLSTGHQLFGLSIVYDWLYHDLDKETRATIRETLIEKSSYLFDVAAKGIIVKDAEAYKIHPWPEWDEAYLQNHLWINSCGIAIAGMAVFDEVDEATRWMAFTLDRYRRTMALLGDDGASHEGTGYWTYGVEWMLKFMHLARELLEVDMYDNEWWRNTWKYRLYMGLPQNSWTYSNTTADYGDSPRYDWYGPDYMLRRLASEYRNGYAQWLAEALDGADAEHPVARWLNLIWYDPAVEAVPPGELPTLYHFTDMEIVSVRSDWSGNESFVFFKCGPYIGHKAIQEMIYCPSSAHHVHPDTNNFVVFAEGEWLIRDDGYRAKWTGQHNTLLIDGEGQLGGGGPIFDGIEPHGLQAQPRITRAVSTPALDHLTGDATEAYPRDTGLRHYKRHLLFLKPDVLLVLDDILLDEAHELELRFHPEQQKSEREGNVFIMHGERAVLRLDPLIDEGVSVGAGDLIARYRNGNMDFLYTVRLIAKKAHWLNAVALSWAKAEDEPAKVTLDKDGDIWTFAGDGRTVVFDWKTGEAELRR